MLSRSSKQCSNGQSSKQSGLCSYEILFNDKTHTQPNTCLHVCMYVGQY